MKEPIIYTIMVSRNFPANHPRKGEPTYFSDMILNATKGGVPFGPYKIHTIRQNYPIWKKRMEKIQSGEAVLSICEWDLPGGRWNKNNTKIEICKLGKEDGIGIQKIEFITNDFRATTKVQIDGTISEFTYCSTISANDGLFYDDFKAWFKGYDLSKEMVIIHFTNLRY